MSSIELLDCTLRDGGYINNWIFGEKNINMICEKIYDSKIDYIELGYIDEDATDNRDSTKFSSFEAIKKIKSPSKKNICMIDYGKFSIENVPLQEEVNIWGIRVAFTKKDLKEVISYCKKLKNKGYKVFVQPMVTATYSEEELKILLEEVNNLEPYAVYIVDSFGYMNNSNIIELMKEYDKKLKSNIKIGFHAHNNLQLAFSNAITFISNRNQRDIIIDCSVLGIGRGAGNLCTELIAKYLGKYQTDNLLIVIDKYLRELKKDKKWGYSIEYYLSAVNNCHPNYAKYLSEKDNIDSTTICNILKLIDNKKKLRFDKEYVSELYINYINEER